MKRPMKDYDHLSIEKKWQKKWDEAGTFRTSPDTARKRFFVTVAWPYPSGPMHVGHGRTYTIPDVIARYKRMKGFNALFPMGWHLTGSPIVGATQRIKAAEPKYLEILREKFGIPQEQIDKIKEPRDFADYWINQSRMGYKPSMNALGYSIDWTRECTSLDPHFSKMVEWQYRKLKALDYVTIGSHPVKFCPKDKQALTDHDLLEGEGVGIQEFTLLKYRMDDGNKTLFFPAATLRPETVFGVTNIWLHPDADYVELETGGERWLVSKAGADKLHHQGMEFKIVGEHKGRKFMGKHVRVPLTDVPVPILPAEFVVPEHTTGVVGSVPAHAPFDYVALLDLQRSPADIEKFGLNASEVHALKPIHMIDVEGYKDSAVDLVNALKVADQHDFKNLDQATKQAYKLEYSKGMMSKNCGPWSGHKVSAAKEELKHELVSQNLAGTMFEFTELPVVCRCGTNAVVRVVNDQWFIRYSDQGWKKQVHEAFGRMELIPPECATYFNNVVDWLNDWPCTRRVGLGTKLPWDDTGWIIESLSDSTIYMAYYTLVPWMKKLRPEQLNDTVYDYIFLKKGDAQAISKQTGIPEIDLNGMQAEFHYWYPQNYRVSANELIPNHLTFMIFHHLAIFPKELCPQGIVSLGLGVLEGKRMSSSKGVVFAVSDAVDQFGADVTRLYLMYMCEPPQDFDWRGVQADAHRRQMERFFTLAQDILAMEKSTDRPVDRWMLSRLQHHAGIVGEAFDTFQTRKALQHSFFLLQQDVKWYLRRGGASKHVLRTLLDVWVRLLTPITPHICEELWEMLGNEGFVSNAEFPVPDEKMRDPLAEFKEDIVKSVTEDIGEILKVTKLTPKKIILYTSPLWKWTVFRKAIEMARGGHLYMSGLMKALTPEQDLKPHAKEMAKYAQKIVADIPKLSQEQLAQLGLPLDEPELLADAKDFFASEFSCDVQVFAGDDPKKHDPVEKARQAAPVRPAIYIE